MSLRVLLAGQEAAGAQILRNVADSEHELVAVLTQDPTEKGGPASLSALAERLDVQVLPANLVRDPGFADQVRAWSVDILLNAHSLHIISGDVLTAPLIGSFNLHPGPLPEYAGLNTVGWAIYNGAAEYGVTVHWMAPEIDTGPVAFQERFLIEEGATALTLSTECTRRGVRLLAKVLERAAADPSSIPAEPQDLSRRVYYPKDRVPRGGRVDWTRSAHEIDRFARAFDYGPFASPWGRPFMEVAGKTVELVGLTRTGEPAQESPGTLRLSVKQHLQVASRDEWFTIAKLQEDGSVVDPALVLDRVSAVQGGEVSYGT